MNPPSTRLSPAAGIGLACIVAVALALRIFHLDWDDGHAFHPDERAMAFAVERVSLGDGRIDPDFFAYGTLPIYLVAVARDLAAVTLSRTLDYSEILLLGRFLSVLAGVGSVVALFFFGLRKAGLATAALAAFLLAVAPIHLQNSRYFTVDALLALLTLLALVQMVKLAASGAWRPAVLAGIFLGLACGTKLSGASLLIPLLVSCGFGGARRGAASGSGAGASGAPGADARRTSGGLAAAGLCAAALLAAAGAFLLVEPMLLVRPASVLASLAEQARIARHAGLVPYTLQYLGTPAVLYPMKQLLFWGLGPVLGVAVLGSAILRGTRREAGGRTTLVLVSWLVPYLAFFAFLEVKYPRYLLPAVPILLLAAAWIWTRLARAHPLARAAVVLIAVATAFQGLAFANLFGKPHTAVSASAWFFAEAPDRSAVLVPDWDEGFPLELRARADGKQFETLNAPYYDQPDDAAKLSRLAALFAKADFVVFPTRRIYGSIFRARERFPLTSSVLANLFAGNLGFELVAVFESRPHLLGLELADELADESVTAYDHPRVLIFRKKEALTAAGIAERALGFPSPPWALDDFLGATPAARPARAPAMLWVRGLGLLAAIEILGLVAFALLRPRWRGPGAFAAAKVLGLFGFAYVAWLVTLTGGVRFDEETCTWLFAGLVATGAWAWGRSGRLQPERRELLWSSAVFYSIVALVLVLRALHPAIFWGEKPMDFGILNQLLRTESMPPQDPWFAGSSLNYSYFGQFAVALLGKLSGLPAGVLFNVALALFAGLAATASLAAGLLLTRRIRTGLWALALLLLLGNLSGIAIWLKLRRIDFDFFWATSRVIPDTINEYPFWSFLFADLHAHLLALPLVILTCGLAARELRGRGALEPHWADGTGRAVLTGWLLGLVAVTSSWSALSLAGLLVVVAMASWWRRRRLRTSQGRAGYGLARVALPLLVTAAASVLCFAPYWSRFRSPERNFGIHHGPVASAGAMALLFGLSLVALSPLLLPPVRSRLARQMRGSHPSTRGRLAFALVALAPIAALAAIAASVAAGVLRAADGAPLPARWILLALSALAFAALLSRRGTVWAPTLALTAAGLALITAAEFFFLWDRMNTVFKYHYDAWVLLALAAAVVISRLTRRRAGVLSLGGPRAWALWRLAIAVALVLALATSVTAAGGALRKPRVSGPSWTLDGTAFLSASDPDESAAFRWLSSAVPLGSSVLEAYGPAYGPFGRVSMHTGLPTPLGWDYHVFQRAHPWTEIGERKRLIESAYGADRRSDLCEALRALKVGLAYFGGLERATYGAEREARWEEWSDLLHPVYRNSTVTIFRVLPASESCSSAPPEPIAERAVSMPPSADLAISEPRGLVAVADGYWVSDFGHHRVVKFDLDRQPVLALGRQGARAGEFSQPCAVATTREGDLLVADTWNHRLQVFDAEGRVKAVFGEGLFGPRGVAVDPETGDILVADTGNHRLVWFSPAGDSLGTLGKQGAGPGEFWEPTSVAISADRRIAVADNGNGRVQVVNREGRHLANWPLPGWRSEVYSEPALVFSPSGVLWLTVPLAGEVEAFDRSGSRVARLAIPAAPGSESARPMGIALTVDGRSLVVTMLDGRLVELPALLEGSESVAGPEPR